MELRLRQIGAVVLSVLLIAALIGAGVWIVQLGRDRGAAVWIGAAVAFACGAALAWLGFMNERLRPGSVGSAARDARGWRAWSPALGVVVAFGLTLISPAAQMIVLSLLLGFMIPALAFVISRVGRNPARWTPGDRA